MPFFASRKIKKRGDAERKFPFDEVARRRGKFSTDKFENSYRHNASMNPNNATFSRFRSGTFVRDVRRSIQNCTLTFVTLMLAKSFCFGADPESSRIEPPDLTVLSFEDLMRVKVTTVSKKPEQLFDSASAVYVITEDDIRRSGYTTIGEALRLAPGMQVARLGSHQWRSARAASTGCMPTNFWY
jgi:hypothetical protein